jgi:K+-transporting ATPase A subunit
LDSIKVNHSVVIFGNALLFLLAMISLQLHMSASKKENPNVLVRSIMMSTFLKMILIAVSVLIYVKMAKETKSKWAIFVTMFIYLIYMAIELKIALKLNKKQPSNARK